MKKILFFLLLIGCSKIEFYTIKEIHPAVLVYDKNKNLIFKESYVVLEKNNILYNYKCETKDKKIGDSVKVDINLLEKLND